MIQKKDRPEHLGTGLTVIATFLMGFIDAYTFLQQGGSFASAQTGNLVSLSVKLFSAQWSDAMSHIWVFAGFALGAFIGEAVIERSENKGIRRYRDYLLLQTLFLFVLALFQNDLTGPILLFTLGALAGYELTTFRKFRGTSVNNGIMTGNTKTLMNNLYQFLFNHDPQAKAHFLDLVSTVGVFVLGAGAGTLIIRLNASYNLWTAFAIALLTFAWTASRARN